MGLTLQINNLKALERLIGGDSEIELDIRKNIAMAFAEKHIKSLMDAPVVDCYLKQLSEALEKEAKREIHDKVATFKRNYDDRLSNIEINLDIKSRLETFVINKVSEIIMKTVEEQIKSLDIPAMITRYVQYSIDQKVKDGVKKRLDDLRTTI